MRRSELLLLFSAVFMSQAMTPWVAVGMGWVLMIWAYLSFRSGK